MSDARPSIPNDQSESPLYQDMGFRDDVTTLWTDSPDLLAHLLSEISQSPHEKARTLDALTHYCGLAKTKAPSFFDAPFAKIYYRVRRNTVDSLKRLLIAQTVESPLAVGRGDSPIEIAMFAALYVEATSGELAFDIVETPARGVRFDWAAAPAGLSILAIESQIELTGMRPDFIVSTRGRREKFMIVECDGHEFHEKKKEQSTRDKARARGFQAEGYSFYPFTGSEIWRDPCACADEIIKWAAMVSRDMETAA